MKKVWLIYTGEYSGRECHGYCTSEEEAQKYCAAKNSTKDRYSDYYEYEEAKCLDGRISMSERLGVGVSVEVTFKNSHGSWVIRHIGYGYINARHSPIVRDCDTANEREVVVWMNEFDEDRDDEKVRKIAQDALYKRLAEQEEAGKAFVEKGKRYLESFMSRKST